MWVMNDQADKLPPVIREILPGYRKLLTVKGKSCMGFVLLRDILREMRRQGDYDSVRHAIERAYVAGDGSEGWYFTTDRMGTDIQIQLDREIRYDET